MRVMTRRTGTIRGGVLLLLLGLSTPLVLPSQSRADDRASVQISPRHWAYEALEILGSARLLTYPSPGLRPLTRHEISGMIGDLSTDEVPREPYRTALNRLRHEFPLDRDIGFVPYLEMEAVTIGSTRDFRKNLDLYTPHRFSQGLNLGLQFSLGAELTRYAAIFVSPYVLKSREGLKTGVDRIHLNLRTSRIALEIGKDVLWWGMGYHGNFVMTDNPPPLPMMKIRVHGGGFRYELLLADGLIGPGGQQARLVGASVEWSYFRRLAIQGSLGIVSEGRASDLLKLVTSPTEADLLGNQIAELGCSLSPWKGVRLYGVTAGDDIWNVGWAKRLISWGRASAYLVGAYLADPLRNGKTSFRIERARLIEELQEKLSDRGWGWYYQASERRPYPYLYKGYLIGHSMARAWEGRGYRANRRDLFLRITHRISPTTVLGLAGDLESAEAGVPSPASRKEILPLDDRLMRFALDLQWITPGSWSLHIQAETLFEKRTVRGTDTTWSSREDLLCRLTMRYRMVH